MFAANGADVYAQSISEDVRRLFLQGEYERVVEAEELCRCFVSVNRQHKELLLPFGIMTMLST